MKEHSTVVDLADDVVNDFVKREAGAAHKKLTEIQHGQGCSCHSCKTHWVSEVNSWVNFVISDEETAVLYEFHINEKGDIYQGEEHERDPGVSETN